MTPGKDVAWLTSFRYIEKTSATLAQSPPLEFKPMLPVEVETGIYDTLYVVNKHAELIPTTIRSENHSSLFVLLNDVVDLNHWSYCDGKIDSGAMRRHCYSGDPILEDLKVINSSFFRGPYMSVSLTAEHHRGPVGMLYAKTGMEIDVCGDTGWKTGEEVVLSVREFPGLRVEVQDGLADVWIETNSVDTAGSIVLCVAILIALSHLTAKRRSSNFNSVSYAAESIVNGDSGLFVALRLTAGLLFAVGYTIITRGEGILLAQKELGDMTVLVGIAVSIVVAIGSLSLVKSLGVKVLAKDPKNNWARVAYLTCEILLLTTLAYSIPKSYGNDIVVASLFLIGLASAALIGETYAQLWLFETQTLVDTFFFGLLFLALAIMTVTVMIFPMIVYCEGITVNLAWCISVYLFFCVLALPMVRLY